jgi:hypothetical protein
VSKIGIRYTHFLPFYTPFGAIIAENPSPIPTTGFRDTGFADIDIRQANAQQKAMPDSKKRRD